MLFRSKWNAQYQQSPTSEEGAIIKREWWKIWEPERPPVCEFIIQSWDTAFTKSERSDYSACTTWGVFYRNENPNDPNVILLDAFKKRMEFPELKEKAFNHYKEWEPERPPVCEFIIQSWDTAFTKSERSDYSACTTWGVFYRNENPNDPNVILLDAFKKRMEFPELKEKAFNHYKE